MNAAFVNCNSHASIIDNSEFEDLVLLIRNGKVEALKKKLIDNPNLFLFKDKKGYVGWTILTYASRISYVAIDEIIEVMVQVLLFHTTPQFIKLVSNEEDREGYTPLMIATYSGKFNRVKSLLKLLPYIDINVSDNLSKTPLSCAIINSKYDIAELLIRSGCDKTIKDKDNKVAFDYIDPKKKNIISKFKYAHHLYQQDKSRELLLYFMVRYGLSDVPEVDVQPDSITCEKTKNLQASIKVSEYVRRMVFTLVGNGVDLNNENEVDSELESTRVSKKRKDSDDEKLKHLEHKSNDHNSLSSIRNNSISSGKNRHNNTSIHNQVERNTNHIQDEPQQQQFSSSSIYGQYNQNNGAYNKRTFSTIGTQTTDDILVPKLLHNEKYINHTTVTNPVIKTDWELAQATFAKATAVFIAQAHLYNTKK